MVLPIVKYGHPILRQKGKRIESDSPETQRLIDTMLETMAANHGVGLAAQQVASALQLAVIDVRGVKDRPSWLELDGVRATVADHMPMVLINPEWTPVGPRVAGPEGCLSFPEIYADVERPEAIDVVALNRHMAQVRFRCGGLLARAIQHEWDHLQGILFIDRMDRKTKDGIRPEIEDLQHETREQLGL